MFRRSLVLAALVASVLYTSADDPAASAAVVRTPFRTNLLVDPGAEQAPVSDGFTVVDIPGWTQTSNFTAVPYGVNGFPPTSEATRIQGGVLFFAGGPNNSDAVAKQRVVIRGRSTAIDSGKVRVRASAWLAGWDGQTDAAQLVVRFLRGDGSLISTMKTSVVSATDNVFKYRAVSRVAPVGTRSIEVVLAAKRGEGSYNDGYFDRIDLRIIPV